MTKMDRRTFIKSGLMLGGSLAASRMLDQGLSWSAVRDASPTSKRPNILLIITDQQRNAQHWPKGWVERNLPSQERLMKNGVTFTNAFTAACECSPSRASFFTGTYPSVHGVVNTPPVAPHCLRPDQETMFKMMQRAGYKTAYKGKWHMTTPFGNPSENTWTPYDIDYLDKHYKVFGWNPPDAGISLSPAPSIGGGIPNNDRRYVSGMDPGPTRQTPGMGTSAIDFLEDYDPSSGKPFFLVVSLANPHDVNLYPKGYESWGYDLNHFRDLDIELPGNLRDELEKKPSVQRVFMNAFNRAFPLDNDRDRLFYTRFYAYLHKVVDREIMRLLNKLDERGLTEDTIIFRFSDHGEMGLSHGLRQKMWNAYSETINIPLIISNPRLFPKAQTSDAMASLIDLMPTVAALAGTPGSYLEANGVHGKSLVPLIHDPGARVQDGVLFTYDNAGDFGIDDKRQAGHIRSIRQTDWMYAVYYTDSGDHVEYEMYNLRDDPYELMNLAHGSGDVGYRKVQQSLHVQLTELLSTYRALPKGFKWPRKTGVSSA